MFIALSLYTTVQTPFRTCDFTRPFTDKILSPSSKIFSLIETSPFGKKKVALGYSKEMDGLFSFNVINLCMFPMNLSLAKVIVFIWSPRKNTWPWREDLPRFCTKTKRLQLPDCAIDCQGCTLGCLYLFNSQWTTYFTA